MRPSVTWIRSWKGITPKRLHLSASGWVCADRCPLPRRRRPAPPASTRSVDGIRFGEPRAPQLCDRLLPHGARASVARTVSYCVLDAEGHSGPRRRGIHAHFWELLGFPDSRTVGCASDKASPCWVRSPRTSLKPHQGHQCSISKHLPHPRIELSVPHFLTFSSP